MNDGLLLFVKQVNEPLFGPDEVLDPAIEMLKEAGDCLLFLMRWNQCLDLAQIIRIKAQTALNNPG